jgi:hypothetical protein
MAKPGKFTKDKKQEFLKLYKENDLSVGVTCEIMGISRGTFYRAREVDHIFADELLKIEKALDDILFNYIMDGLKDHDTRLNYLKLLSSNRIDKIMKRGLDNESNLSKIEINLG